MKINNHNPLIRTGQPQARDDAQKVKGASQPTSRHAEPAAKTHLSHEAANASQDIDVARVAEIREAIRDGRLEIHADRIADGLIDNVRELLGHDKA
ncbi:MAG: flagellar biosynthesis anti-sigma factor FlgM [Halomonas sp.]|uniref:flagellar biosynthesis anti-sigma factor FlgM n=1 Tax=Halomonas sp. TaxID=1486246 RepID=UPI0039709726